MNWKVLAIGLPIAALGGFVLLRALLGRPLSRRALNVIVALFLLAYVLTTAALGVFWVSRMDLPAFDLHYVFGYAMLVLLAAHVVLQLGPLAVFFRRVSPKVLLDGSGSRFVPAIRYAGLALVAVVFAGPLAAALVLGRMAEEHRVSVTAPRPGPAAPASAGEVTVWIERGGERIAAQDYLYEQSSYSRAGVLRAPALPRQRPPELRVVPEARTVALPAAALRAERTLAEVMGAPPSSAADAGARIVVERAPARLDASTLADILAHAGGVTSERGMGLALRAAPSAGALYPVDLFVVLGEGVEVPAGVHYYDPHAHALRTVAGVERGEALTRAVPEDSPVRSAPLVFALTGTWDRTAFKYDVRSYRYVALDAGHVAAQLLLAARARGMDCALEGRFDDGTVATALGLHPDEDGPVLLVACGPRRSGATQPLSVPAFQPVQLPERADDAELTRLSHALTSWRLIEGPLVAVQVRARTAPRGEALPLAPAPDADVFATIRRRRSVRDFDLQAPLDSSELAGVLLESAVRAPRVRGVPLVELHVLVSRVDGVAPGSYRYAPEAHALEPGVPGALHARIQSAGLSQEVLGRGAAVLVWTLNDATLGAVDGARDFRTAGIDAGLAGGHAYLAATARGLGACGVGAFYDAEVGALLAGSTPRPRPLYLISIGHR